MCPGALQRGGNMRTNNKMIGVAILVTLGTGSQQAVASGFQLMEQNASGLGNAYAGQAAAAENASTIFFNPAGMTQLPGKQISGTLSIIRPTIDFTDNGASRSPAGAPSPAGGGNGGDAGGWNYIPSGYFSWQLTPRLWAGIGVTAPFGLNTDYDLNYIGRFQSQKAELKTYDVNPSLAFKINDAVSIGGGLSYQHAKLSLDRSFFAGAALPQTVSLSDNSWGWNLGAMFNLGSATRLGLSYRSEMKQDLAGSVTVVGVGNGTARASTQPSGYRFHRNLASAHRQMAIAWRRHLDTLEQDPERAACPDIPRRTLARRNCFRYAGSAVQEYISGGFRR